MKETAQNKKRQKAIIISILTLITSLIICCFCGMLVYLPTLSTLYNSEQSVTDTDHPPKLDTETLESRTYLDPDLDDESYSFSDKFDENFTFTTVENLEEANYLYEKYFVKANLQAEYERLNSLFNRQLSSIVHIEFTDDQDLFEELYGFDYQDTLSYAGLSSYGEILFLVSPEKDYSKEGLKRAISHELIHTYQFDSVENGLYPYPLWFSEGTAEYFSEAHIHASDRYESSATLDRLDKLDESLISGESDATLAAYNLSNEFIKYLVDEYGEDVMISLMLPNNSNPIFSEEFEARYLFGPDELYISWFETFK